MSLDRLSEQVTILPRCRPPLPNPQASWPGVIHGNGWRSLTAGTWQLQSGSPDKHDTDGVSLLPEPKQTLGAVVEQMRGEAFTIGFLARVIREVCLRVQENLEAAVEL
jgi:hypothetical protein